MEVTIVYRSLLDHEDVQTLLAAATMRVEQAVENYKARSAWKMLGFSEGDELVGLAGYEKVSQDKVILLHIAVDPKQRGKGVGRQMINYICRESRVTTLEAETDRSAVEFYRKCGFAITSLGEKYPGVERFQCVLHVERSEDRYEGELVFSVNDENYIDCIEASKQVYWMYQDMISSYQGFGHNVDYEYVDFEKFMLATVVEPRLQGEYSRDLITIVRRGALVALCCHVHDLLEEGARDTRVLRYIEALLAHPMVLEMAFEQQVFEALKNTLEESELEQDGQLPRILAEVYDKYVVGHFRELVEKGTKKQ